MSVKVILFIQVILVLFEINRKLTLCYFLFLECSFYKPRSVFKLLFKL